MRIRFVQRIIDKFRNKISCLEMFADKYEGAKNNDFETMIIGSSHLANAYRTIKGEYNFAIPSQDLYYSWNLYKKYSNPNVKNIIFSFSVFTPGHNIIKCPFAKFAILYNEIFGIPYQSKELADKKELYKDEERYRKAIKKYFSRQKLPKNYYGSYNSIKASKKKKKDFANDAEKHWKYGQYKPSQMEYFINLLNATRDNNQNLYIIIPPVTEIYKNSIPTSDILYKELYDTVKNYNHVKIFNYYDNNDFGYDDFIDGDHLNIKGGEKLTAMFRKDLANV